MAVRNWHMLGLCLLFVNLSGCSLLYKMHPSQWNKLNRVPPPTLDPEFTQVVPVKSDLLADAGVDSKPAVIRAQNALDER